MLDMVGRIARAVRVPVTADMEAGYSTSVADMAETAKALVNAGAGGLNLEDVNSERGRSEERRVGEEGRSRGAPDPLKKKKKKERSAVRRPHNHEPPYLCALDRVTSPIARHSHTVRGWSTRARAMLRATTTRPNACTELA